MHVIVTGGSSGIGLAIAKIYASRGARVSLIARDAKRLRQAGEVLKASPGITAVSIHVESADVSSSEEVTSAIRVCEKTHGPCDILVASAGIVEPGAFDAVSPASFDDQITTNVIGTANAVRAVYAGMKNRGHGQVMIISSGAALIGIYGYAAYCASKSALAGFAEALSAEATGTGVRVSICFPPDTLTPQYRKEMLTRPREAEVLMGRVKPWTAEAVSQRIVRGIDRKRSRIYFDMSLLALGYLGPFIKPVLSRWFRLRLAKITVHLDKEEEEQSAGIDMR